MANTITLEIVGLRELKVAITNWGEEIQAGAREELETLAKETVAELKAAAPVGVYSQGSHIFSRRKLRGTSIKLITEMGERRGGNLQRQIGYTIDPDLTAIGVRIRARARHAHLVEFGHQGPHPAPAHPWFVPVVVRARQHWYKRLFNLIQRVQAPGIGPGTAEVRER